MILTITNAIITAYIWTSNPCSNSHFPVTSHTVATSDRSIPLGSIVVIGKKRYVVMDRTNKCFAREERFDIYVGRDKQFALKQGIKREKVVIYEK